MDTKESDPVVTWNGIQIDPVEPVELTSEKPTDIQIGDAKRTSDGRWVDASGNHHNRGEILERLYKQIEFESKTSRQLGGITWTDCGADNGLVWGRSGKIEIRNRHDGYQMVFKYRGCVEKMSSVTSLDEIRSFIEELGERIESNKESVEQ